MIAKPISINGFGCKALSKSRIAQYAPPNSSALFRACSVFHPRPRRSFSIRRFPAGTLPLQSVYVDNGMVRYRGWRYLPSVKASYLLKNVSK